MQINAYTTIAALSEGFYEEKRSRFLSFAAPVETEDRALSFVEKIKKAHNSARHVAFAYIALDGICRASDSGEPSGSAGAPILDLLRGFGTPDAPTRGTVVAVARYFGGVLLGVGGLIRAYGGAAEIALAQSAKIVKKRRIALSFSCQYTDYGKIAAVSDNLNAMLANCDFRETVMLTVLVPPENREELVGFLTELSSGKIIARDDGEHWV